MLVGDFHLEHEKIRRYEKTCIALSYTHSGLCPTYTIKTSGASVGPNVCWISSSTATQSYVRLDDTRHKFLTGMQDKRNKHAYRAPEFSGFVTRREKQ